MKKVVEKVVKLGRPVNVNSVRQIRLKELEMKKELTELSPVESLFHNLNHSVLREQ